MGISQANHSVMLLLVFLILQGSLNFVSSDVSSNGESGAENMNVNMNDAKIKINNINRPKAAAAGETWDYLDWFVGLFTEVCPLGWVTNDGDTPGWGQLGGGIFTGNVGECTQRCEENPSCCSIEYSPTEKLCNLNRDCTPSAPKYKDYLYCTKRGGGVIVG